MSDAEFVTFLWDFYTNNKRSFPWRETKDPYAILVSEVMLQQTQTSRVLQKYAEWLTHFPTAKDAANAPLNQILLAWNGLGYNRRAKFLWLALQEIVKLKQFPDTFEELRKLPGIGDYTANAVLSFAFNIPTIVVETNIRTAIIHTFFKQSETVSDKDIKARLATLVPAENPRDWYYALMDYGNFLKSSGIATFHKQKGYIKQKPFKGSKRYVRGFLLREVLQKGQIILSEVTLPGYSAQQVDRIAQDLVDEGLVKNVALGTIGRI